MLVDTLKKRIADLKKNNQLSASLFLRNSLKEVLQFFVLEYIYSSSFGKDFLFTGGTCLRFCFDLPRLSEDLDFDVKNYDSFSIDDFCESLSDFFKKDLQYKNFSYKIARNKMQVYLRFEIMEELGLKTNAAPNPLLFLRLDVNPVSSSYFTQEVSLISENNFNFVIKRYSLEDLFASKLSAVVQRTLAKGKNNKITFKGRDYFDLIWFLQKKIQPNYQRIQDVTTLNKQELIKAVNKKVAQVEKSYLKEDLSPLFTNSSFVNNFTDSFQELYQINKSVLL